MEFAAWQNFFAEQGEPQYRSQQVCEWLYTKHAVSFEEMTNLSKGLRARLEERVAFHLPALEEDVVSRDGTRKFLWRLEDGETVESVLMKHHNRMTACLSSQVGCSLGCAFCVTGQGGFRRNLAVHEMVGQFLAMERVLGEPVNNLVFMGMGEPFLNTSHVLQSIRQLQHPRMRGLGIRHVTISTAGILPGIRQLAASGLDVRLAVSLHAADGRLRSQLMPINNTYPLQELMGTLYTYQEQTGNRVTVEYLLLGGVNDRPDDARRLAGLLSKLKVFVNLIPCNTGVEGFQPPTKKAQDIFRNVLQTRGFEVFVRTERGGDVDGACGQLRERRSSGKTKRGSRKG
ncbi:MAG: 23S rRNA (adenine(2503)-C(2))-methyltransferase RlmN [Synergistales bacterium]|nr:23S rRNA (adenine(2503)-C(2))-methyltransferase RlmN [Synergistales bacterium]